jgi:hypothetical protein
MPEVYSFCRLNYTPAHPKDAVRLQDLQTAAAPPSYPGTGSAQTGGTWVDGKPIWREVLLVDELLPGTAGAVLGTVTGFDHLVRFEGYGSMDSQGLTGYVAINGSGFSAKVMPDGEVRLYGPEGDKLFNIRLIVDYLKA